MSDGYIDTTMRYSYDGNNNRLSKILRLNYTGQDLYAYYWTYNSVNQMLTEAYEEEDNWGNFERIYLKEWTYNTSGLMDLFSYTPHYNGYAESYGTYQSYAYNSNNQMTTRTFGSWDWCCSFSPMYTPTSARYLQYDIDGNLILESIDSNLNGTTNKTPIHMIHTGIKPRKSLKTCSSFK